MLWIPNAERRQRHSGGSMVGGPPKVTHHITYDALRNDGSPAISFDGVCNYLLSMGYEPTVCIDPITGQIVQFLPADVSASALRNLSGGVETNRHGRVNIQVEWYFTPGVVRNGVRYASLVNTPMRGLSELLALSDSNGVPRVAAALAGDRSTSRWVSLAGHYGHYNVPENDHSDPVAQIAAILGRAGQVVNPGSLPGDPVLGKGDDGEWVKTLQALLVRAGQQNDWPSQGVTVDGDFGPMTDAAVRDLQARAKLTVDGIVGPMTWAALRQFDVGGAIGDLWNVPKVRAILGSPLTDELTCPDGIGRYVHFSKNGSIYWTPKTGSHEVHGGIRAKWAALGWETCPFLGYPRTDELTCPDGIGRLNHFERGSIFYTPATGAHEVHGSIRDSWAASGWEAGPYGYPTCDEFKTTAGRGQEFQKGIADWNAKTGAVAWRPR